MKKAAISFLLLFVLCCGGCYSTVNRSIHIGDGDRSGGCNSVNGNIDVGSRCRVTGSCSTVNGNIVVCDASQVHDLNTVNGGIRLGKNVDVDGNIGTINGPIDCGSGSRVHGRLDTINGGIGLQNTSVDHEISTVNGNVTLAETSVVHGGIRIRNSHSSKSSHPRRLEIRIGGGSHVENGIIVDDEDIEVKVYLSKDSIIDGEVKNARVIRE
jgi:DUF4097 and DUF4098 domain-containing protein YvlB